MQDILPPNQRKNFSYFALLAMQHYRFAFQNSFSGNYADDWLQKQKYLL
jgi:hypothetical protein